MSENYIVINGNKTELTKEQMKQLGIEIKPVKKERWRAESCEGYWYVSDCGKVNLVNECEMDSDNYRYNSYNYFKTKEAAEKYAKVLNTQAKIREVAEDNEPMDWDDTSQMKYYITYNFFIKKIDVYSVSSIKGGNIYFSSRELAERAISVIGEDALIEYFTYEWGVGECAGEEERCFEALCF